MSPFDLTDRPVTAPITPPCDGVAAPIRVLIVEDHPLMREGIASAVRAQTDMRVVADAHDGRQTLARRPARPDVIVMDLHLEGDNGIDIVRAIRRATPDARIMVLTTHGGDVRAQSALRAGAMGCLLKSAPCGELLHGIRTIHAGRRYISQAVAEDLFTHMDHERPSQRELSVLRLVADGLANKAIARTLGISEQTVKAHLKSLFAKLDVTDRTHAVTVALRRGMLTI